MNFVDSRIVKGFENFHEIQNMFMDLKDIHEVKKVPQTLKRFTNLGKRLRIWKIFINLR